MQSKKRAFSDLNCFGTPVLKSDQARWPLGDTTVAVISAQKASDCKPKAENKVDKLVMLRSHDN
jgi:hypothetical protein